MKRALIIFFALIWAFSFDIYSQSKKKIVNMGIESVTVVREDYEDSNGKETIRSVTVFDKKGNVIEEKDYDAAGKLSDRITYEYNQDNDKIKETHFKTNDKIEESYTYKYKDDLIMERCKYDGSNRLISKKKYVYKFSDE